MSDAIALSVLRGRVRRFADINPEATTGRYPTVDVNREINAGWKRAREIACINKGDGHQLYLKSTGLLSMTIGTINAGAAFGSIPLPADCVSVYGVDVLYGTNEIVSLEATSWSQRNLYIGPLGTVVPPRAFCVYNIGTEAAAAVTAGSIAIMPAPDRAYQYQVWYTPTWVDRTLDTDVFDGINGHHEWAIMDAVVHLVMGDNDMQACMARAAAERDKAEILLSHRANQTQRVGAGRRRDVASQQRWNAARAFWRLP